MSDILSKIKTKSESKKVLRTIDHLINASYKVNHKSDLIDKLPFSIPKNANTEKYLSECRQIINNCDTIDITIAINPSKNFVSLLYKWFLDNDFSNFLLNISVDTSIMGGLHISYKGKFYDLSLLKKVKNYVQQ